jgi:tetratricopeptide (TPR) repeat protein
MSCCLTFVAHSASSSNEAALENGVTHKIKYIEHDIKVLQDAQIELRRDQLNYKIEKDLLKESYSTSLQTVNLTLTFILGLFSILGYLGVRDIGSMKKEYAAHLEKLELIRVQLELKISKVDAEQITVREEMTQILQANKQQDHKIRTLELQEQVSKLCNNRQWTRALEYIAIGLEIAPDDYLLKSMKAVCYIKLRNFSESVQLLTNLLEQQPDHPTTSTTISNLAEVLLLLKNFEAFDKFKEAYQQQLLSLYEGSFVVFLDTLKACLFSDPEAIKETLKSFAESNLLVSQKNWIQGWELEDVNYVVAGIKNEEAKRLFWLGASLLTGSISTHQLLENLK